MFNSSTFRGIVIFCFDEFVRNEKGDKNETKGFFFFFLIINILVATALDEASHRNGLPVQSVMVPPAPSITGTRARKSYG